MPRAVATLRMAFESRIEHVSLAGAAIRAMCEARGAHPQAACAVELAAVEVATNIVVHGYGGRVDQQLRIRIRFGDDQVLVEISDRGEVLAADSVATAELPPVMPDQVADLPEGGFGLALLRHLTDRVELRSKGGWNTLSFARDLGRADTTS